MVFEPLVASVPPQLPEAVQLVASMDDQVRVVELPTATDFAASVSVGAAGTDAVPLSPPPPQAATRTVTRIRKTPRRLLRGGISLDSPILVALYCTLRTKA
jgi:hypothetical protein